MELDEEKNAKMEFNYVVVNAIVVVVDVGDDIDVWTKPLRLNLLGPGNGRCTYLDCLYDLVPKLVMSYYKREIKQ